jgi:Plasmid pRiA4b ORF-3-like protein
MSKGEKLIYTYGYGDCWEHLISFEHVTVDLRKRATCTDGGGATPPEDCGGRTGYKDFLLAVNDPLHEDYIRTREWAGITAGEHWDVHAFNQERTVSILKSM